MKTCEYVLRGPAFDLLVCVGTFAYICFDNTIWFSIFLDGSFIKLNEIQQMKLSTCMVVAESEGKEWHEGYCSMLKHHAPKLHAVFSRSKHVIFFFNDKVRKNPERHWIHFWLCLWIVPWWLNCVWKFVIICNSFYFLSALWSLLLSFHSDRYRRFSISAPYNYVKNVTSQFAGGAYQVIKLAGSAQRS